MLSHGFASCRCRNGDPFDVVPAAYGLQELPSDVRMSAVRQAARVLRRGGLLLAVDIDPPPRPSRVFSMYMRWIEKPHAPEVLGPGLSGLLESADFEIRHRFTEETKPVPFQLIEAVAPPA